MRWLRLLLIPPMAIALSAVVIAGHYYYSILYGHVGTHKYRSDPPDLSERARLREKVFALRAFGNRKKFNQRLFFLIDMKLPSGRNRFFVYDAMHDSIIRSGLVAHGHGPAGYSFYPRFSNSCGSSCTALGRYQIGACYHGIFGIAYKLYGLDSTNSNSLSRHIVLHAHDCVPDGETWPVPICNSCGCAMTSPRFLEAIRPLIDTCSRPILLWIFY
ncbi:MAG TPA: murein L,D-transpeptidase catalytic domain family protein [Puia sp.]|nr:murein L,D-transpeptidase catalytic domain family protein [Puia sp.]